MSDLEVVVVIMEKANRGAGGLGARIPHSHLLVRSTRYELLVQPSCFNLGLLSLIALLCTFAVPFDMRL